LAPATAYFCGLDVAKRQHYCVVLNTTGKVCQRAFPVSNDRQGFTSLLEQLQQLPGPVVVALEATGHYWLALYQLLPDQGYRVLVFNPLQIHNNRQSGLRLCKTDRSDARWIADFARIGQGRPAPENLPVLLQLRELTRFRFSLTTQTLTCGVWIGLNTGRWWSCWPGACRRSGGECSAGAPKRRGASPRD
jgi:transposase